MEDLCEIDQQKGIKKEIIQSRSSPAFSTSPGIRSRSRSREKRSRRDKTSTRSRRSRRSEQRSSSCSSRSRSRSRRSYSRRRQRSCIRSLSHERRIRYFGSRENPFKSRVIGIFGLSSMTNEAKLMEVFEQFGSIENVSIIHDAKTGNSRGFGFIYYKETDQATRARTRCNGMTLDGKRIRVDYSITKRAHTPTPGVYMGAPKSSERDDSSRRHRSKSRERSRRSTRSKKRRHHKRSKERSRHRRDYSDHESSRYSRSRSR